MRALSMDLRERIVAAYENEEGSYLVLAARFAVSRAVVGKLVRQHREQWMLEPQVHRRGRKPAIQGQTLERLRKHLAEHPDRRHAPRTDRSPEAGVLGEYDVEDTQAPGLELQKKSSRAAEQDRSIPLLGRSSSAASYDSARPPI